jgi:hypothetical protein
VTIGIAGTVTVSSASTARTSRGFIKTRVDLISN